jgi:hypothetical protein
MTNAVGNTVILTGLAAIRQAILNSFGDNDTEAADLKNMERLYAVEKQIEDATYQTDADKRVGK